MRASIVVSLLTGARTEEMRALRWHDVDLAGQPEAEPPIPPNMVLVRSVRVGGPLLGVSRSGQLNTRRAVSDAV